MVRLEDVLMKLGEGIQQLIGEGHYSLLKIVKGRELNDQGKLVEIVLDLHTKPELLRDKDKRAIIINRLEEEEANDLAFSLGIPHRGTPFRAIREKRINKGSSAETALFAFFGVVAPEEEEVLKMETLEFVEPRHGLYPHQIDALRRVEGFLEGSGRVMLHMPTGSGKTRTAMNLISKHLNKKKGVVLWLAHSEELCEQAVGEFKESWSSLGDRPVHVRRFFKSHEWVDIADGLVVAGLSKLWLYLKDNPELAFKAGDFSMIVFDEAHQSIADTFQLPVDLIMLKNRDCKLLGLTATPGRTWNEISEDERLAEMYSHNKVSLEVDGYDSPIDYLIQEGYISKPVFVPLEYEFGGSLTASELKKMELGRQDIPASVLKSLSEDNMRTTLIIKKAEQLVRQGHERVLIFATNVKHARTVNSFLNFDGFDSRVVTGETDSRSRAKAIRWFKEEGRGARILCNYGVLTTGFDAPKTSAAIIARPTQSLVLYSQMVGRAIRGERVGGTETAEIVTVVDTNLHGFGDLGEAFTNWDELWKSRE